MQFSIFLAVGIAAVLVHYLTALILVEQLLLSGQAANFVGFWGGFAVSYLGQSLLTFKARPTWTNLLQYLLLAGFNYCASAALLYLLVDTLTLNYRASMLVVVCVLPLISFAVSKKIIFADINKPS